jgi:type VI secretion system protein VasI
LPDNNKLAVWGKIVIYKIFALGVVLFSSIAIAGTKENIANCAANDSDAVRLICYDNLSKSLGVDKPKTKITKGKGKWRVREDKSAIDDSVNVYLSISANESIKSGYNTARPSLYLRCAENKTNIFLTWDLYLGLDETRMLIRFDKQKAKTSTWSISTDNKAVFVQGSDIKFAKEMMKHDKLLTQVTPYGESPVMATFDIRGLSEAIIPLRKTCHW